MSLIKSFQRPVDVGLLIKAKAIKLMTMLAPKVVIPRHMVQKYKSFDSMLPKSTGIPINLNQKAT